MDILTIGEVLIDLTQTGKDARGIPQFAANPGGAPANLAVAAARLGAQTAFIGKVGADAFGRYLKEVLQKTRWMFPAWLWMQTTPPPWRWSRWMPPASGISASTAALTPM